MKPFIKVPTTCFGYAPWVIVCLLAAVIVPLQKANANAQYQKDYINAVLPWAQQAHATYGVPVSVAIAQSVAETGWYLPKADNNFFNIGYAGPDPYTIGKTSGGWRAYKSGSDAFLGYGHFLTNAPNFTGTGGAKIDCRTDLNNPLQFLHDVAFDGFDEGYNAPTSVKQAYYDKVASIIDYNNLTQYDVSSGSDTDIYVDKGNSAQGQDGSARNPFNTVKAAVDKANATQPVTIHIVPGTYSEKIGTSKHIHFVTNGSGMVRIGG